MNRDGRSAGHAGARGDAYDRRVRSAAYREERSAKAAVILHLCASHLSAAGRLADMGSGTGLVKKELERKTGKCIFGFELDRSFIEVSERTAVADVTDLPTRAETFDFLLLNHLYEHVEDQQGLFREAYRVLRPGGWAYVSAGNRLAVMEPHYRLPFLSWLPRGLADRYLRWTGRGRRYEGIRFRTRGSLERAMTGPGFRVHDLTERAVTLVDTSRGSLWRAARRVLRSMPAPVRGALLHWASPQWFFLLEKPRSAVGAQPPGGEGGQSG